MNNFLGQAETFFTIDCFMQTCCAREKTSWNKTLLFAVLHELQMGLTVKQLVFTVTRVINEMPLYQGLRIITVSSGTWRALLLVITTNY